MAEKNEPSLGKITSSFAIKFVLWTVLFAVIGMVIVGAITGGSLSSTMNEGTGDFDDLVSEFKSINGMIYGFVLVDIIAALLAAKLSVGGITKKTKITSENRPQIFKRASIVIVIVAILVIIIHICIVKFVDSSIMEEIDEFDSLGELIDEAEDDENSSLVKEALNASDEDEYDEGVKMLKSFNRAGHIYSFSGILFLIAIPVTNSLLKKKEEN